MFKGRNQHSCTAIHIYRSTTKHYEFQIQIGKSSTGVACIHSRGHKSSIDVARLLDF